MSSALIARSFFIRSWPPTDNAATVQIKDDGKVEPTLRGPDIGYIAGPFAVGCVSNKIPLQPVRCNTQPVVAVSRSLVLAGADRLDPIDLHQSPDAALANIEPNFLQRPNKPLASCEDDHSCQGSGYTASGYGPGRTYPCVHVG